VPPLTLLNRNIYAHIVDTHAGPQYRTFGLEQLAPARSPRRSGIVYPVIGELVVQLDGEAERAQDDVGDDETHDERVGGRVQTSVTHEDVHDDAVAAHSHRDDDRVQHHNGHLQPQQTHCY